MPDSRFVVTWDNGTGYREWATTAQPSQEAALKAAGITEDSLGGATQFDYQVEEVNYGAAVQAITPARGG